MTFFRTMNTSVRPLTKPTMSARQRYRSPRTQSSRTQRKWLLSGVRIGEAAGLKWKRVDLLNGVVQIRDHRLRQRDLRLQKAQDGGFNSGCQTAEVCGRSTARATEKDLEGKWGKFCVREQGGPQSSPAHTEPDRDYPSPGKNKDGHSHQRQRHASILHHKCPGSERAHEFHPEAGRAHHDTHDGGPLLPARTRAGRWRSAGRSVEFYHPPRMLKHKYIKLLLNNGGGGGGRIRMAAPCENADTSGFYSISGTWNRSRQRLIPFNFFNTFMEHKAV